jgi:hypothetical protein
MKKLSAISYQLSVTTVFLCVSVVFYLLAGCVPAQEPDVLKASPGPGFIVTDRMYENNSFTARYPSGWRVQSGEATQPLSVLFVAPDEVSYIQLQVGTLDGGNFPADRKTDVRGLTLSNGVQVTALLNASPDNYDTLLPIFEQVIASIQPV